MKSRVVLTFVNKQMEIGRKLEVLEVFLEENHPNPQFFIIEWRPNLKLRSQPQMLMNFGSKYIFGLIKVQP